MIGVNFLVEKNELIIIGICGISMSIIGYSLNVQIITGVGIGILSIYGYMVMKSIMPKKFHKYQTKTD